MLKETNIKIEVKSGEKLCIQFFQSLKIIVFNAKFLFLLISVLKTIVPITLLF
jgi:hypothetical protein